MLGRLRELFARALRYLVPSYKWPRGDVRPLYAACMLLFFLRIVVAGTLPLVPDEAYYWIWSRHLQWGYLDHPLMVAVWGRVGTWCFGDYPLAIRLCGLVASFLENIFIYYAAKRFFPERKNVGAYAILLLNALLVTGVGVLPMTPDTPLIFFVCVMLWALAYALEAEGTRLQCAWWSGVGGSLGCAVESKYTAVLLGVGLCGFVMRAPRALWKRAGPWVGALCTLFICLPAIGWNITHNWAGFLKQGGRTAVWHPQRAVQFLSELWAGQFALVTPWVACLFCVGLWRARREQPLILWLFVPGGLVFLLHACGDRVQANWVWVLYPACVLVAAAYGRQPMKAAASGIACVAFLYVQLLTNIVPLPSHWNPAVRLTSGWKELAAELSVRARDQGVNVIATDDYALASILFFYKPAGGVSILGTDRRWTFIAALPAKKMTKALYIEDAHYKAPLPGESFIARHNAGQVVRYYRLELREGVEGKLLK